MTFWRSIELQNSNSKPSPKFLSQRFRLHMKYNWNKETYSPELIQNHQYSTLFKKIWFSRLKRAISTSLSSLELSRRSFWRRKRWSYPTYSNQFRKGRVISVACKLRLHLQLICSEGAYTFSLNRPLDMPKMRKANRLNTLYKRTIRSQRRLECTSFRMKPLQIMELTFSWLSTITNK